MLASLLLEGLAALRAGKPEVAVAALQAVCDDEDLAEAAERADVRARAHSLLAQALL